MAGADPRLMTTAPLEPWIRGLGHDSSSQDNQQGPMFLLTGADDTLATSSSNQAPVFERVTVPVFWGTLAGASHLSGPLGDMTGFRGPMTAWYRWMLMGDESAAQMFVGADCGLCNDPNWLNVQKRGALFD